MVILAAGLDLLAVNPGLVIWTAITFIVVLLVLWLTAWKPIIKALDERNSRVEDDLEKSRALREEAEDLMKEYQTKLDSATQEAVQIIEKGRKDSEAMRAKILSETQEEAASLRSRVSKELELAKIQALSELEAKVVDTAISVISGILAKDINDEEHKQMVMRELEQIKGDK